MSETQTPESKSKFLSTPDLLAIPTQRDWLIICRALEASKDDVLEQSELLLPALCWINRKRLHGGAEWEEVLALTDKELLAELGVNVDSDEQRPEGKDSPESATSTGNESSAESPSVDPVDSVMTSPESTPNGDSIEHGFASTPASPSPSTTT